MAETDEVSTAGRGSTPRGVLAGIVGVALSAPLLALSLVVSAFLERTLVSQVLGREMSHRSLRDGKEDFLGHLMIALATGAIGAGVAAYLATKLVRRGASKPFLYVMAAGLAVLLAAAGLLLKERLGVGTGGLVFYLAVAWIGGLVGILSVIWTAEDEAAYATAEPAEQAAGSGAP